MSAPWIDVSAPLRSGMVCWPGDPEPRIERLYSMARGDPADVTQLALGAHTGPHVDAPAHFLRGRTPVDSLPLEALIGPARVVAVDDPRAVTAAELAGRGVRRGERLLFRTRNSARPWNARPATRRYVALTLDAARLLAARGVRTVGVDSLSVGVPGPEGDEVHRVLGRAGICVIEGLLLGPITPGRYDLCCLPLRLAGAEAAPARVVLRRRR